MSGAELNNAIQRCYHRRHAPRRHSRGSPLSGAGPTVGRARDIPRPAITACRNHNHSGGTGRTGERRCGIPPPPTLPFSCRRALDADHSTPQSTNLLTRIIAVWTLSGQARRARFSRAAGAGSRPWFPTLGGSSAEGDASQMRGDEVERDDRGTPYPSAVSWLFLTAVS